MNQKSGLNIEVSMKKIAFLIVILHFSIVYGQDSGLKMKSLKLYSNVPFDWDEKLELPTSQGYHSYRAFYFSPAFTLNRINGDFHELELSNLGYEQKTTGIIIDDSTGTKIINYNINRFQLAFRYEYNVLLFKFRNFKRINPYMGVSAQPYFVHQRYRPFDINVFTLNGSDYEIVSDKIGINVTITPRILIHVSQHFYADLNMPLCFFTFDLMNRESNHPFSINFYKRQTIFENWLLLHGSFLRLGIGIKL
jgi:hypothetical protein